MGLVYSAWLCAFWGGSTTTASLLARHNFIKCRGLNRFVIAQFSGRLKTMNSTAPRILVIDNYDSFVYNLVQYLGELGAQPIIVRNDQISVDEAVTLKPDGVLLSPGPGQPHDAGILCEAIRKFAGAAPIFGVCLGHQAIGHVFGAQIVGAPEIQHGKTSEINHNGNGVFKDINTPIFATRYHSLVIEPSSLPDSLTVTASTPDGIIMGVRHRELDVEGVQFHPESVLTDHGHKMIKNFIRRCEK
jgi:anthranilate synthase/aminodeoxychorismate synthase-like glutamine amidotransferase